METSNESNNMITEDIPDIICACCILHNMCEAQDEQFCQGWLEDTNYTQPEVAHFPAATRMQASRATREILMEYVCSEL